MAAGGGSPPIHRKHAVTHEAFRCENSGGVVDLQRSFGSNLRSHFPYNYQAFVPRVRARRRVERRFLAL